MLQLNVGLPKNFLSFDCSHPNSESLELSPWMSQPWSAPLWISVFRFKSNLKDTGNEYMDKENASENYIFCPSNEIKMQYFGSKNEKYFVE